MEIIYFTLVAVALYFLADALLDQLERRLGRRLEYRSLIFFGIILALALLVSRIALRLSRGGT